MLAVALLPFTSTVPTHPFLVAFPDTHNPLNLTPGRRIPVASACPCAMLLTAVQCAAQLLVGGALAAGFRLTNKLLGSTPPKESVDRQARAARAKAGPTSAGGVIDIEAKVLLSCHMHLKAIVAASTKAAARGILVVCKTADLFQKQHRFCSP